MRSTIQARLDPASRKDLAELVDHLGWTPSEVVREALRLMAATHAPSGRARIIGVGQFDSGIPDLGSNKKHLKGFGR